MRAASGAADAPRRLASPCELGDTSEATVQWITDISLLRLYLSLEAPLTPFLGRQRVVPSDGKVQGRGRYSSAKATMASPD